MRETGERQENILKVRDLQLAFLGVNGRVASMVFQDPMSAFDPVYPIGQQIAEVLLLHPACFTCSGIEKRTAAAAPRLLHSASLMDKGSTREAERVPQDETCEAKHVSRDALRTNLCQETNCSLIKNDSSSGEKIALLPRIRQIAQTEMTRLCRKKQQELRHSAEAETVTLLAKLGFDEPARRARQYPH